MRVDYPLFFEPSIHPAVWGRESWEISAHSAGPSVIANGAMKGQTLDRVMPGFPLLFKIIDAKTRLSVQVHPNERTAQMTGGEPKTEMWCALNEGFIYAGLRPGVTADDVARAVADGSFEGLMERHETHPGDVYFIPGGLVHAIGDGTRLFEVQQSSNTTYRLYDWGRVGPDGKPRELHVVKGLQSVDFSLPAPRAEHACACAFFDFRIEIRTRGEMVAAEDDSFVAVHFPVSGRSVLLSAGVRAEFGELADEDDFCDRGGACRAFVVRGRF